MTSVDIRRIRPLFELFEHCQAMVVALTVFLCFSSSYRPHWKHLGCRWHHRADLYVYTWKIHVPLFKNLNLCDNGYVTDYMNIIGSYQSYQVYQVLKSYPCSRLHVVISNWEVKHDMGSARGVRHCFCAWLCECSI